MSDLPRLLLCSFDVIPGPSGSSRRLTEYLKALPDRFSVVVLSAKTPDHSHIEKYQGARLLRVPVGSGDLVSRIQTFERAVRRQLDSEEYALAHFTDPFGGYVLCEMKGDYGYRLVYEAQTFPSQELRYTHPQTESDKRFLAKVRRQELFCLMNADLVITGSQTTRTYIQSLGASTEQIRVIRSPVDLGSYTPDVVGVPDGQPMRLMYLGSQAGWQGLPTLMRALALAVEQGAEVKLILVGARHPDWQPHLEDLAKELGLQEYVEFQPPVLHDDLAKVLALADVGVLPLDDVDRNRLQGGPLAKVSEYFAAGRPVLAADLPVTRELLPPAAVLFHTAGDARSLAASILELARDLPRRLELGREARAYAEQELDAGLIRGKLLDIYDELLGRRSVVGTATELPMPTTTGTPTNRVSQIKPPEGGGRRSRGKGSDKGKGAGKKGPAKDDLPLVLGSALSDDGMDTRLIKTEPDMHPSEPPVVMGRPLRDKKPTGAASRKQAEEPPTSIVTGVPVPRDGAVPTPTPIVRALESPPADAPPAPAATAPRAPAREEEPPAPTPIVPMKPPGETAASASARAEPVTPRPPVAPAGKTGTRSALQEPLDQKGRTTSLPPVTRAPPAAETRGPPPRLEPIAAPSVPAPPPPEKAPPPSIRIPAPPEMAAPPLPRVASTPEPIAAPLPRVPPPPEGVSLPRVPSTPEPVSPPSPRAAPPLETPTLPPLRPTPPPIRPSGLIPTPAPVLAHEEEPEEISEEEAQEISDEVPLDSAPTPRLPRPKVEEPEELSNDEVQEASADMDDDLEEASADAVEAIEAPDDAVPEVDAAEAVEAPEDQPEPSKPPAKAVENDPARKPTYPVTPAPLPPESEGSLAEPPSSALDPWFAQVAHGYCPPEGAQFARHTPPTNFPGRDEEPTDPTRVPPASKAQGTSRVKS